MKVVIAAALVLASGCKGDEKKEPSIELPVPEEPERMQIIEPIAAPERPASVTDQHMALVDRLGEVAIALEKIVRDHGGDCDATAAALTALTAKSAADVATTEAALEGLTKNDPDAAAYIEHRLEVERAPGVEIVAASELCKGHKGVKAAVAGALPLVGLGDATVPAAAGGDEWSGPHPPGITDEQVAVIDEMGALFGKMSAAAEKAAGDCAAMAKAFQPLALEGRQLAKRADASQKDVASRSPAAEWLGQYTARKVDMQRFIVAVGACQKNKAVQQALQGMDP